MSEDAPEKIWVFDVGNWADKPLYGNPPPSEYTRSDIHAEVVAERDELKNVVNALEKEVSAYVDSLLKALRERDGLREALEKIQ